MQTEKCLLASFLFHIGMLSVSQIGSLHQIHFIKIRL